MTLLQVAYVFRRVAVAGIALGLAVSVVACAAPERINVAATLMETKTLFAAAQSNGARDRAPFQYYSAELYLQQARQLHSFGRTEESAFLANRALQYAREALYLSEQFRPAVEE